MLRSMYSGISGLKNFQTKLDVIGNNISNVNTHGFKKGRVVFKDLISQTQSGASGPGIGTGGVNAKQVGLGSQLAAIDTIMGTGSLQQTGRTLDIAIEGEGFFVIGKAADPLNPPTNPVVDGFESVNYTRAGNFYMDAEGYLVNTNGDYLVGYSADSGPTNDTAVTDPDGTAVDLEGTIPHTIIDDTNPISTLVNQNTALLTSTPDTLVSGGRIVIPTDAQSMAVGTDGSVTFVDAQGNLNFAGQLLISKFSNAEGLVKDGGNYYVPSANSGVPQFGTGNASGIGKTVSGTLEMSNVDLSEEFTEMIVAQRGFQANSRIITTSDEILQELVNLKR